MFILRETTGISVRLAQRSAAVPRVVSRSFKIDSPVADDPEVLGSTSPRDERPVTLKQVFSGLFKELLAINDETNEVVRQQRHQSQNREIEFD